MIGQKEVSSNVQDPVIMTSLLHDEKNKNKQKKQHCSQSFTFTLKWPQSISNNSTSIKEKKKLEHFVNTMSAKKQLLYTCCFS